MGVTSLLFCLILILMIFEKRYFVYQGHQIFEERILAEKVCLEGFDSIVNGQPDSSIVSAGVISILKTDSFEIDYTKVLKLNSIERDFCQLIVTTGESILAF